MSFRAYLRCDGTVAMLAGVALVGFGLAEGHQGIFDATQSGILMLAGTGVFMMLRHRVPFRQPAAWFTATPLARADAAREALARGHLVTWLLAETVAFGGLTVGLSYLTDFWLTYVDFGIWAIAVGAIKAGPAAATIADHELRSGTCYRIARRPLRGVVELTAGDQIAARARAMSNER
jgi:hypothetical protein